VLTLALAALYVPLAWPARDFPDGGQVLLLVAVCLTGVVVARRQLPACQRGRGDWSAAQISCQNWQAGSVV